MSNHTYPRRLLDDAIDRAVHDLARRDPRPGFRRRVLAQLNAAPPRMSWIPKVLVPVAAIAAVLILAVWLRPHPAPTELVSAPASVVQSPQQPPAAASPEEAKTFPPPVRETARRIDRKRQHVVQFTFGPPSQRVVATSVSNASEVSPATDAVPKQRTDDPSPVLPLIRLAPIEGLAEITVKPIEIRPIAIAPQIR